MDHTLTRLAAEAHPTTKTAARAALKCAGLKQTLADDLLAAVAALDAARISARRQTTRGCGTRTTRRLGYTPVDAAARRWPWEGVGAMVKNGIELRIPAAHPGRRPVTIPTGSPAARLQSIRESAVRSTYHQTYRTAEHGEITVMLTSEPAAVGVRQTERQEFGIYGGAHKNRPCRIQDTTVTVPTTWRVRVARRGLAVVDGMMTLDAAPIDADGCELFAAVWLVQGRGTSTSTVRGYIARRDGLSYHAETAAAAIAGIAKKARAQSLDIKLAAADLSQHVSKCPAARVTVGDARAIGACEYGIQSWCAATGLPYESGSATLAEVYAAYTREPRSEARATIIRVLRRHRAQLETI